MCFVLPNKIHISPFHSHSLLDRLNYFLLISQVRLRLLADVAHQMYRAHHYLLGFLSCAFIIALSIIKCRHEIRAIELLSRTIYKLLFLLHAAPRCLATVAASQWPRELRLLKSCLNTRVAQVRKDISQVRTSITVFSQATSRQVVWEQSKSPLRTAGFSLWARDDGTILISICLRIIDISIPDLTQNP